MQLNLILRDQNQFCICILVPLYADRGAMAAAGFHMNSSCPRPKWSVLVGLPYLLTPIGRPKAKGKEEKIKEITKEKVHGGACHMAQAGLPPLLVLHRVLGFISIGCGLGVLICLFIAWGALIGWDPTYRDPVAFVHSLVLISMAATARRCPGPMSSV